MSQLHAFFRWFRFVGTLVSFSTLLHLHGASALGKNSFAYFAFEQERTMHEHVLDILHYPRQETHILLGEQQWLLQVTKKKLQNSLGVIPEYTSLKYAFDEAAQDILNLKILCSKDVYLGSERMKKELILRNPQNQENVCGEYDYWYTTFAKKRDDAKRDLMAEYEKIVARHRELEILVRGMGRYRAYSSKTATAYFVTDFDEHEKLQSITEKKSEHLLESLNEATTHGDTSPSRVDAALEYICSEQPEAHTQILHICPKSITHEVLTLRNLEWTYKQIDFVTNLEYWTASDLNALTNYFQKVIAEEERQHAAWQLPADHAAFIKLYTSPHILFMGEDQIRNKGLIQIVQEIMTGQQNPSDLFKDTEISYADSGDPLLELHIMLAHLRNADEHRKNIRLLRIVGERLFQEIEQRRTMLGIIGGTYLLDVKTDSWSKVQLVLDLTKLNFIYDISRQIIDAIPTSVHVMDAIHQVLGATFSLPQDASFPTERDIQLHQQLSKAELHTFRCMQQVEHATDSRSLIINDEDMFSALSDTMEVRMSSQIEPEGMYPRQRNAIEACRRFLEHVILIHVDIMTEDRKSAEGFEYSTKTASLKKRKQLHVISGIVHEFLHNFEHETDSGQLLHYEAFFKTWFSDRNEALNALRQELSLEPKPLLIFSGKLESDNYHEMQRIRMHTALQEALVSHQSLDDYTLHAKIGELEWLIYSSTPRSVARLPDKNAQMNESVKDWFIDIKAVISALVKQYKHDDPSSFQQLVASDGIIKMYESKFSPFTLLSKLRSKDGTILKRIHGRLLGILSSFKETALSTDRESLLLGRTQLIEFLKAELYTRMQYQTAVVLEQPGENAQSKLEIIMYDTCGVRESHHDDEELCPSGVVQTFMELRSMEHELARSNFILELNALSTAELEALRSHVISVIDGLGVPIDEAEFAKQQLAALEKYEQLIRELSPLYRMRNDEVSQHGGSSDEVQNLTQKINALEAEQLKMLRQAASTDISFENPIHRGLLSGYTHPAQDYQVAKFDIEQIIMHREFENELILKHHTLIQIRLKREVMQLRTELGLFHNQSIMQDATSLQTIRVEVHNLVAARRMLSELYEQEKLISSSDDFDTFRAHYHARHDEVYQKCAARLSAIPRNLLATETEGSMRTLLSVIRRTHVLLQACMNQKLKNDYTRVCMEDAIPHWLLHSWFWNSIGEAAALLHTQKQCEEEFELVDGVYRLIEERYLAYCSVEQTDPPKAFSLNILQRIFLSEIHRTLRALHIDVPGDGEVAAPSEVSSGVPRWVIALLIIFSFMIVTSVLVLILIHVRRSRSLSHRALNSKIIPVSDSAYESLYEMQES